MPAGLTALREDVEANFKAVLQSGLAKLDLVTRQEFEVQSGVLRRTREKLEALQARVAALEAAQSPAALGAAHEPGALPATHKPAAT